MLISAGQFVRAAIERALRTDAIADPLQALSQLNAPTADVDQMLAEIDAGRA